MTGKVELLHDSYPLCHISSNIHKVEVYIPLTFNEVRFIYLRDEFSLFRGKQCSKGGSLVRNSCEMRVKHLPMSGNSASKTSKRKKVGIFYGVRNQISL